MISKLLRKWVFEKELDKSMSSKQLDASFKISKIAILVDPITAVDSRFLLNLAKMFKISGRSGVSIKSAAGVNERRVSFRGFP